MLSAIEPTFGVDSDAGLAGDNAERADTLSLARAGAVVALAAILVLFSGIWASGDPRVVRATAYSWREKVEALPRVLPFLAIILGVLYAVYGGIAGPSETAAVGASMCLVIAMAIYRLWSPAKIWDVLRASTKEPVMLLFIIGAAGVFGYMLSQLFIAQSNAEWIGGLEVIRWVPMVMINRFLLVAGFFLPPAAVILRAAPILLPIITTAGSTRSGSPWC